jgi:hypothetical protein
MIRSAGRAGAPPGRNPAPWWTERLVGDGVAPAKGAAGPLLRHLLRRTSGSRRARRTENPDRLAAPARRPSFQNSPAGGAAPRDGAAMPCRPDGLPPLPESLKARRHHGTERAAQIRIVGQRCDDGHFAGFFRCDSARNQLSSTNQRAGGSAFVRPRPPRLREAWPIRTSRTARAGSIPASPTTISVSRVVSA